jgi:hypothetical protein
MTKATNCCNGDMGCQICMVISAAMGNPGTVCCPGVAGRGAQGISDQIAQAIGAAIGAMFGSLKPELIKAGVFILGLALFIAAWMILLHPGEVSSA